MKALLVAGKTWLELIREWQLLLLIVAVPIAFVWITKLGYGSPLLVTYPVLVMNTSPQGEPLVEEIKTQRYADGRPIFDARSTTDPAAAEAALKEQLATALVKIAPGNAVTLRGDALSMNFYRASIILESLFSRYADRQAGRPEIVRLAEQPLTGAGPQSMFDLYAPGMILFALLLTIPQVAMLVAREIRWNTLRRLRLTPLRAWELLTGISLAQMAVAVVVVALLLTTTLALGFHSYGSLWLALVVGLAVNFSAVGLGLIVACFIENDGQAINVGSTVTMLQVFLSGSFYQMPPFTLFTLAGHPIDLFDIFPATHGFLALQQVLSYGAGLAEIAFRLGATLVLSVLYLGVGVAVFQRLQMQNKV